MEFESGGRVTLKLASVTESVAEYGAELSTPSGTFAVRAEVRVSSGAVDFSHEGSSPPDWLLELARTTLRAAHRTAKTGGSWPRRLSRWRGGPGETED